MIRLKKKLEISPQIIISDKKCTSIVSTKKLVSPLQAYSDLKDKQKYRQGE